IKVSQLKKHHVKKWLNGRTYNSTSKNRVIGAVKRVFQYALEEEFISKNPIAHLKKPKVQTRDRILTTEERELILGSIKDERFREYVTILTLTGCRPGEAARVTKADVFLDRAIWELREHKTAKKTGRPRIIYLCPEAIELTRKLMERNPEGSIFL